MKSLLKKYKPALFFIAKFVAFYLALNVMYGILVESYGNQADLFTSIATAHTSQVLNLFGLDTDYFHSAGNSNVIIHSEVYGNVLSVYEGCNGINVMIIFFSFLMAFKWSKDLIWFVPVGVLFIHLGNLIRISLLYVVSIRMPSYLYFSHKYLFTAFIFIIVFILWFWWLKRLRST